LRAEAAAGRLKVGRVRPGSNAKIVIREDELQRWLEEHVSSRQHVERPGPQKPTASSTQGTNSAIEHTDSPAAVSGEGVSNG